VISISSIFVLDKGKATQLWPQRRLSTHRAPWRFLRASQFFQAPFVPWRSAARPCFATVALTRRFRLSSAWFSVSAPLHWARLRGLLLFRFLPKNIQEHPRRFSVPLPKCRPSPWEQTPLAFECPNYEGRKWRKNAMSLYVKWNSFGLRFPRRRFRHWSMICLRWPLPERRPATPEAARLGRSGGSGQEPSIARRATI